MLSIRRYEPADHEAVKKLHIEALQAVGAYIGSGPWDDDLDHIQEVYLNGGEFLVGIVDGEIVTMGALKKVSDSVGEIKRMRTDPRFWRHGFARQILDLLEVRARQVGYKKIVLDTQADAQTAARNLYEKSGYRETHRGTLGGRETIYYEKDLQ